MEILVIIIAIAWTILGIILFFKIWGMTNNVKEMHDWLLEEKNIRKLSHDKNQNFTPHSERGYDELPKQAIQAKPYEGNLKKGDLVTIAKYGTCSFEGIWQGKYAFYPVDKTNLPDSPYLVNDVEPYLLIPQNQLGGLIV